jgi:hypothetical protein
MVQLASVLTAMLAGAVIVRAHPGETLEHVRAELKTRSDYIKLLMPQKRMASCRLPNSLPSIQQTADRREEAVKALRGEHNIKTNVPDLIGADSVQRIPDSPLQGIYDFFSSIISGWHGAWRKNHKRSPSGVAFLRNNPAAGKLPRYDWGSYGLESTLVLAPSVTEGPYCTR